MYTEHFGFQEDPFGVSPDPRFLYLGPAHHEAFAALLYGVKMRRGFMCLIGEPGTGKTTLLYALLERLEGSLKTVFLPGTDLTFKQRLQFIIESLGAKPIGGTVLSLTRQLQDLLADEWRADSNVVLIFDEAQNLTVREMEDIRLLTNFEVPQAKLLQVILVGQPQLRDKLALPELAQLKQRITVNVNLRPLTLSETAEYIEHRLRCTEWNKPLHTLFSRPVVAALHESSRGIPRLINAICHNALLIAYAENKSRVEMAMIQEAAQELDLGEVAEPTPPPQIAPPPVAREVRPPIQPELTPTPAVSEVLQVAAPVEPEPEIRQPVVPVVPEPVVAAAELSEEDLALELGREIELTFEMGEPAEPEPEAQLYEVFPEIMAPETTLAAALTSESAAPLEPVVEVSQAELIPEVREVVEFGSESGAELEPALDLEHEITFLSEEREAAEVWPEVSEAFEPAAELGQGVELVSKSNGDEALWPEASEAVELVTEPDPTIEFRPKPNGKFTSALGRTDLHLSPPEPKTNGESGTPRRIVQPKAPRLRVSDEPKGPGYQVKGPLRVSQKPEPAVFGYGLEPGPTAVVAPATNGRKWRPTHPAGLSLNQLLDELESFAQVREPRPAPRPTHSKVRESVAPAPAQPAPRVIDDRGEHEWQDTPPSVPEAKDEPGVMDDEWTWPRAAKAPESTPATVEPKPTPRVQAEFETPTITGQQVRLSMERPRLSTPHMVVWALFFVMVSLSFGILLGIILRPHLASWAQRYSSSPVSRQEERQKSGERSQPAVPTSRTEDAKPQPVVPPPPVVQPETPPPSVTSEAALTELKLRTVTVRRGDDLPRILRREYGYINRRLVQAVQAANPQIADWDYLEVGDQLNLPLDPEADATPRRRSEFNR